MGLRLAQEESIGPFIERQITSDIMNSEAASSLEPIVAHLLYGDIDEMPLDVLGDECPTVEAYNKLDVEQSTRIAAAATVQAWIERRLHKGGYIWKDHHSPGDLVPAADSKKLNTMPAEAVNTRLFDLVRYMRSHLYREKLISDEDYTWLCDEESKNGPGSPSPRRLEDYDAIREKCLAVLRAGDIKGHIGMLEQTGVMKLNDLYSA